MNLLAEQVLGRIQKVEPLTLGYIHSTPMVWITEPLGGSTGRRTQVKAAEMEERAKLKEQRGNNNNSVWDGVGSSRGPSS